MPNTVYAYIKYKIWIYDLEVNKGKECDNIEKNRKTR